MKSIIVQIVYICALCAIAKTDNRREDASYSSTVVHNDPKYPDQHAQSSINVQFQTPEASQFIQQTNGFVPFSYDAQKQNDFSHSSPYQTPVTQQPFYQSGNYQDQAFNVGYSVSFTNGASKNPQQMGLRSTEIIRGSPKEAVKKPDAGFANEDFVHNTFLDSKKQKLSGIKSKYYRPVASTIDHKQLLAQANLSPNTQKKLADLEHLETPVNQHNNNQQEMSQYRETIENSPWKILSPSVEIYHSDNLNHYPKGNFADESRHFDHARALGKSEGFDYSNAIDPKDVSPTAVSENTIKSSNYGRNSIEALYTEKHVQPVQMQTDVQYFPKEIQLNLDSKKYLPTVQSSPVGRAPKFPMDTSLLRDPVLTYHQSEGNSDPKILPIRFDTKLIQQAINHEDVDTNAQKYILEDGYGAQSLIPDNLHRNIPQNIGVKHRFAAPKPIPAAYTTMQASEAPASYQPISDLFKFHPDETPAISAQPSFETQQYQNLYGFQSVENPQAYQIRDQIGSNILGPQANFLKHYNYVPTVPNQLYKNFKMHGKRYSDLYPQSEHLVRKPRIIPNFVRNIDTNLKPPPTHVSRLRRMYAAKNYM